MNYYFKYFSYMLMQISPMTWFPNKSAHTLTFSCHLECNSHIQRRFSFEKYTQFCLLTSPLKQNINSSKKKTWFRIFCYLSSKYHLIADLQSGTLSDNKYFEDLHLVGMHFSFMMALQNSGLADDIFVNHLMSESC